MLSWHFTQRLVRLIDWLSDPHASDLCQLFPTPAKLQCKGVTHLLVLLLSASYLFSFRWYVARHIYLRLIAWFLLVRLGSHSRPVRILFGLHRIFFTHISLGRVHSHLLRSLCIFFTLLRVSLRVRDLCSSFSWHPIVFSAHLFLRSSCIGGNFFFYLSFPASACKSFDFYFFIYTQWLSFTTLCGDSTDTPDLLESIAISHHRAEATLFVLQPSLWQSIVLGNTCVRLSAICGYCLDTVPIGGLFHC